MVSWQDTLYRSYATDTARTGAAVAAEMEWAAMRLIDRYLPKNKDCRIADLGCGSGTFLQALAQRGYTNTVGVDISTEQVQLARKRGIENVICGDVGDYLATAEKHDAVVMLDCLEHFDQQGVVDLLKAIRIALVDGGTLLLRVPNAAGFLAQDNCFGDFTHRTYFTPSSLSQVLSSTGYHLVGCHNESLSRNRFAPLIRAVLFRVMALPWWLAKKAQGGSKVCVVISANMLVLASPIADTRDGH
ncbi:MAG: methyltransferase domain-containing protein [Verrucomicrobia bacterium]|nr:methyltransferase domain-containing protein [Verrucomicrobiota bacterium]